MKKLLLAFLVTVLTVFMLNSQQKIKIGYINSNELLTAMPERTEAQKKLQDFAKQLEDQLLQMQTELERKYNDYLSKKDSLTEIVRKSREEELLSLQQRIQTFQENAQSEMQKKEQELLKPIIEKAKVAIEEVAKENGFTYIFDISSGAVLVYPKESSDNILPLVKKKMNIK
ncbi:MAG: OmpH family outer membrane protein [Bacteroidales bacterium]|nr:OmpH family outer membrane protein [Bacteroidales bacterium]